jgi:xanthine dehydrogenase accessory factor
MTVLAARIAELTERRTPFVRATVVRVEEPTSARPGDQAVVLPDGSVEGFVGGQCATGSVRTAAIEVLASGSPRLLRVLPEGGPAFPDATGADVVVNPCLSGGAMEIYLEPVVPLPVLQVVGSSPTAEALVALAPALGMEVTRDEITPEGGGVIATVVATHGGEEPKIIRAALTAGVGFVGLVCSRTRAPAVLDELDELGLAEQERARVHPHVGVEIGARTAPEIALSVLAAVVKARRVDGLRPTPGGETAGTPRTALDPVCGMTVTVGPETPHARVDGTDVWFCGPGCRDAHTGAHP